MAGTLRELRNTESEIARVDDLLSRAYGTPSRRPELDAYIASQPSRWSVVEQDGELIAFAGCLDFGAFAWLGLVATHPAARGRGLASQVSQQLVEWATAQGCASVALDASIEGRPVYTRLGFEQVGTTAELLRPAGQPLPTSEPAELADLAEVLVLDREVFGGDRAGLLRAVHGTWHVARREDGTLGGYLRSRGHVIGPGAARDERSATRLVAAAVDATRDQIVLVPAESAFLDTLLACGFVEQRRLDHMRHGALELPGTRSHLLAQLSYATG